MTLLDDINKRVEAATPGPWAWESVAEKSNEFVVGLAYDLKNECYVEGQIIPKYDEEKDVWIEDEIIRKSEIGCNEFGNANFGDAELIAHAPSDLRYLLGIAEAAQRLLDNPAKQISFDELAAAMRSENL